MQTLTDGGLRFTFDAAETEIDAAQKLMQVKQRGGILEVAAVAIIKTDKNGWDGNLPDGSGASPTGSTLEEHHGAT